MVRKRVLVPLIAAADLVIAGIMGFVLFALWRPCPEPEAHVDDPSAAAPSPGLAACRDGGESVICVRVLPAAACLFVFVLGVAIGDALSHCYFRIVDEEEGEAAGDAKDGYVAIGDCDGGKHE